mmetsp:Transcript_56554/g.64577  ORF Transcript_56554/g.64577 Transcript_56554/m.64577 type:complete len:128 (+) Transcript_56554:586-969(+)
MNAVDRIKQIQQQYQPLGVQFKFVYIAEAHAKDTWPLGIKTASSVTSTSSLEERRENALRLREKCDWAIDTFVDGMEDEMITKLAAWPLRYWVLKGSCVKLVAVPQHAHFKFGEIGDYLSKTLTEGQ